MPIDQSTLNRLVGDAILKLSSLFPTRLGVVSEAARDKGMLFTIANPWSSERPIEISTTDGDLTVLFGESRFNINGRGLERDESELIEDMILRIAYIINENCDSTVKTP